MEKMITATGKTIDLAIESALAMLGLDRDSVSVEVLDNPKSGFLGIGAVPAKVKVTYEAPDEEPAEPAPALSSASRSKPKKQQEELAGQRVIAPAAKTPMTSAPLPPTPREAFVQHESSPRDRGPRPEQPRGQRGPRPDRPPRGPRPERPERPEQPRRERPQTVRPQPVPRPAVPSEPKVYTPAEPGSVEEKIETFLKGLLEHMGSDAVPHAMKCSDDAYAVELTGDNLGILIGRRGETLDAIQHLANYAVNRGSDKRVRINVDAENYRLKREESLQRLAVKIAGKVVKERRNMTLEPMNAYERHVIHAALQETPDVTTYSTGTEPNRRVIVAYSRFRSTPAQKDAQKAAPKAEETDAEPSEAPYEEPAAEPAEQSAEPLAEPETAPAEPSDPE
jgi:spoIIIJ-associated protein